MDNDAAIVQRVQDGPRPPFNEPYRPSTQVTRSLIFSGLDIIDFFEF